MKETEQVADRVEQIVSASAKQLRMLSDDYVFQEAIVKAAIRDFSWALLEQFPKHQEAISDQLVNMAEGVRDAEPEGS